MLINIVKEQKLLILALLIYLSGVIADSLFEYSHLREAGLNRIDEQLLTTVGFAEALVHDFLHKDFADQNSITVEEEYALALKLQRLSKQMQVGHIYAMMKQNEKVKFVVSSLDQNVDSISKYKQALSTEFEDAPGAVFAAFADGKIKFAQVHDHWGDFRSIFFPLKISNGDLFIVGVDISISRVLANVRQSMYKAAGYGLFLVLIIAPLIYSYIKTLRRNYNEKLIAAQAHPITGLPNKRSLENDLDRYYKSRLILVEIENLEAITNVIGVAATDSLVLKFSCHLQELQVDGLSHCKLFHLEDKLFALQGDDTLTENQIKLINSAVFHLIDNLNLKHLDNPIRLLPRIGSVFDLPNSFVLAKMTLTYARETNQSVVMYDETLDLPTYFKEYIDVLNKLSDALSTNRVCIYYQPIVSADTGRIEKYEALARIVNTDGAIMCMPDQFMPIAYQSRLCNDLTCQVVDHVIEKLKTGNQIVSINLSVKDIFDQKTRHYITQSLKQSGVGHQIEFEILEQQVISNYRLAKDYINEIRSHCHGVGMDDMGKLYSNFDRLLKLPLDFLKIDGMVVESMERDEDAKALVDGIINFARNKNIVVIAEFCESESICNMVSALGINLLQGYHLGMPGADLNGETLDNGN